MTPEELKVAVESVWWWHSIEIPGYGLTPGHEPNSRSRDAYMNIPWAEMKGKTVLDIGAWDGLYSFLAEEAGAELVIAADQYFSTNSPGGAEKYLGIRLAIDARKSHVQMVFYDVETSVSEWDRDTTPAYADVCFFFGVLYHLQNPLRALRNVAAKIKLGGLLILETATTQLDCPNWAGEAPCSDWAAPILELCEGERDGDATNWSYPNRAWVEAALRIVGFEQIEYQGGISNRAAWHARKKNPA